MSDAPPPDMTPNNPWGPRPRIGQNGAEPHGETVRVTSPDLRRRAAMEKSRARLVAVAGIFLLLFLAIAGKLADATLINPMRPRRRAAPRSSTPTARFWPCRCPSPISTPIRAR
jgi:cell division protein FtsI (penicillin-binding protein 3)